VVVLTEPSAAQELMRFQVCVLGNFDFRCDGTRPQLSAGSRRLLVFLALRSRTVARETAAGTLWPEASENHAGCCLRSAIARLGWESRAAVEVTAADLRLAPAVSVDLAESRRLATRLLDPRRPSQEADLGPAALAALSLDVLPDWYDDWVTAENEAWHQLRLHGLEKLTDRLAALGRFADATSSASRFE
jgi:DNA-binding SARP family transcriptional activator